MSARPRILVIEDNPDNRALIKELLTSQNFDVIEAVDGEEGIRLAFGEDPALILMDLSLPQKDGWQATRELKQHHITAGIPVVALTAHAMSGDREKALAAGCDEYLIKPIDMAELLSKIRQLLSRSSTNRIEENLLLRQGPSIL